MTNRTAAKRSMRLFFGETTLLTPAFPYLFRHNHRPGGEGGRGTAGFPDFRGRFFVDRFTAAAALLHTDILVYASYMKKNKKKKNSRDRTEGTAETKNPTPERERHVRAVYITRNKNGSNCFTIMVQNPVP